MQSLGTLLVADLDMIFALPSEIVVIKKIFNLLTDLLGTRFFKLLRRVGKNHIRLNRMHPALSVIAPERIIDVMSSVCERYNGHALVLNKLSDRIGNNLGNAAKGIPRLGINSENLAFLYCLTALTKKRNIRRVFSFRDCTESSQAPFSADIVVNGSRENSPVRADCGTHDIEVKESIMVAQKNVRRLNALHSHFIKLPEMKKLSYI